jgi:charged multivesicular body protein 2A
MAQAMKGVTKALKSMNKQMDIPALTKILHEFARENEKSELTQEAISDTLDDAFEEEGAAAEEEMIVNQVLDELGIGLNSTPEAPMGAAQTETKVEEKG